MIIISNLLIIYKGIPYRENYEYNWFSKKKYFFKEEIIKFLQYNSKKYDYIYLSFDSYPVLYPFKNYCFLFEKEFIGGTYPVYFHLKDVAVGISLPSQKIIQGFPSKRGILITSQIGFAGYNLERFEKKTIPCREVKFVFGEAVLKRLKSFEDGVCIYEVIK
jgi:hypothetical protein